MRGNMDCEMAKLEERQGAMLGRNCDFTSYGWVGTFFQTDLLREAYPLVVMRLLMDGFAF